MPRHVNTIYLGYQPQLFQSLFAGENGENSPSNRPAAGVPAQGLVKPEEQPPDCFNAYSSDKPISNLDSVACPIILSLGH